MCCTELQIEQRAQTKLAAWTQDRSHLDGPFIVEGFTFATCDPNISLKNSV
jgi:hypothetical protein